MAEMVKVAEMHKMYEILNKAKNFLKSATKVSLSWSILINSDKF